MVSCMQEGRKKCLRSTEQKNAQCSYSGPASAPRRQLYRVEWGVGSRERAFSHHIHHVCSFIVGNGSEEWSYQEMGEWVRIILWPSTWPWESSCLRILLFQATSTPTPISPSTKIQDIKQHFRVPSSEEKPERRALFSSWTILCCFIIAPAVLKC